MATQQSTGGGRIYSGKPAEVKYKGSATTLKFNPVKAVSTDKATKEQRRRVIEDGEAKRRELYREQEAVTTSLKAQQQADAGLLKLNNKREADALEIEQKYDVDSLKQEHSYEEAKMDLASAGLEAQQKVSRAKLSAASNAVSSLISFAGTAVEAYGKAQKIAEKKEYERTSIRSAFGIENNPTSDRTIQAIRNDRADATSRIAVEDSIQDVDDPIAQQAIRNEVSASAVAGQKARADVYEANSDFPTFYYNWVNDTSVVYTRPDGTPFTVTSMEAGDARQVSEAARKAFYKAADVGGMRQAQVASVLVPNVLAVSGAWEKQVAEAIIAGEKAAALRSAQLDITDALASNENIGTVFAQGFSGVYGSGNYIGAKGKANEDTVDIILGWAVSNRREDVIDNLEIIQKKPGDVGTALGRQYEQKFKEARDNLKKGLIDKNKLDTDYANAQIKEVERKLNFQLAETDDPLQERALNLQAAAEIMQLGTPEAVMRAKELTLEKEYSPFTFLDLQQQQADGATFTQEYLQKLVNTKDIKPSEAETLGWNKEGGLSADTARAKRVEGFKKLANSQAKAVLLDATQKANLGGSSTDPSGLIRLAIEGNGSAASADISARMLEDLDYKLRANPDMSDQEIREWMTNRRDEIKSEVTYVDGKGFQYEFGRNQFPNSNDLRGDSIPQLQSFVKANPNFELNKTAILSGREIDRATYAVQNGQPIPSDIEERAAALGTNGTTLLRQQLARFNRPYPSLVEPVQPPTQPTAAISSPEISEFDTGKFFGDVSLDGLRNAVIAKESTNNFTSVNPDSGALGYGQVMPSNVPSWTRQALGYEVSAREFLRSPDIQMRVINDRFEKMMQQQVAAGYSGDILMRRVASIWYSGNSNLYNNTKKQYYNGREYPSIAEYTMDIVNRYRGS